MRKCKYEKYEDVQRMKRQVTDWEKIFEKDDMIKIVYIHGIQRTLKTQQ